MKNKIIIVLVMFMLVVTGCGKSNYKILEKELTDLSGKYYEEQLKGKVLGLNSHIVTIEALQTAGYDVTNFTNKKCDKTSYSLIVLELDENRDVVGDYKVENHLTCGDYQTEDAK